MSPASEPLTETKVVLAAVGVWIAAALGPGIGLGPVVVGCLAAVATGAWMRRPTTIACSVLVLLSALSAVRADSRYQPLPEGPFAGTAEVLSLPEATPRSSWRAELRIAGRWRIEAEAWGSAADALARSEPGDRVAVDGRLLEVGDRPWLRVRHVVARATLNRVAVRSDEPRGAGNRIVAIVQEGVEAGARQLPKDQQGLYSGLVLGDDREQDLGQRLRFRQAGLTHLLAVSGQNVAFVLAVFRPLLLRLGPHPRAALTVLILVVFALATRLEPSVLRASTTAAIACWAGWSDRATTGLTVLSLAVVGLVFVDPFLVDSVGFQLSVAASLGILALGPSLARRLPGPRPISDPLSVTAAAQIGVSPVLGWHFGLPSLVALPANLAAGWAAGLVMPWGLTGGVVAGLLPSGVGRVVQGPTAVLLWWVDLVATWSARAPAPQPGPWAMVTLLVLALVVGSLRGWDRFGPVVALAVLLIASIPDRPDRPVECGAGVTWYPDGGGETESVLVLSARTRASSLEDCRRLGVRAIDVVVATSSTRAVAPVAQAASELFLVGITYGPPNHTIVGAYRVVEPLEIEHRWGTLTIEATSDRAGLLVGKSG